MNDTLPNKPPLNNTVTWASLEECEQRGGHFWNEYDNHGPHDVYGRQDRGFRYSLGGRPTQYRKCGLCGLNQRLIPAEWEDADDTNDMRSKYNG